jgi:hypothetical protein
MPLYTFYPCREGGRSDTFRTLDLSDDDAAHRRAVAVLGEHASCEYVAIWCGDRMVGNARKRQPPGDRSATQPVGRPLR